jgi:hypothetical protein
MMAWHEGPNIHLILIFHDTWDWRGADVPILQQGSRNMY